MSHCSSVQFETSVHQPAKMPMFLMCAPEFFDVNYVINPWMAGNLHRSSRDVAFRQWRGLFNRLQRYATVRTLAPEPDAPDMTFVAHGAVIQGGKAILSSFAYPERRREEDSLRRWLEHAGFAVRKTPRETPFEGEGDALWDANLGQFWLAHGARTSAQSHAQIVDAWAQPGRSLRLIDPRFYHLDTCFAPLAGGHLLWYPDAFDQASIEVIERCYAAEQRIEVSEQEASQFACNVINIGSVVLSGRLSPALRQTLQTRAYTVEETDLSEFVRAGGSAKSLALRLGWSHGDLLYRLSA